ncbi:hypothetical protein QUF74_00565 [Candidatus Halobeggiatoa sp. HSG11]|nr:hypothetical protein [Candidatus Halobeggiatoa sp. HSG11]
MTANNILFIILVISLFFIYKCSLISVFPTLKRLRWLFFSILILNLFFNSSSGIVNLLIAIEKVIVLITIVLAAHLFIIITKTQEIIAALQWWLLPLTMLGFPTEKLSVRIALVLDTVKTVQSFYNNTTSTITNKITELFAEILEHANTVPLQTLEIPELPQPPLWQWIYPLTMLVLIFK